MAVETIVESIGGGGSRDHLTPVAWKTAHDGEDLTTGGADGDGIIYEGQMYDQHAVTALMHFSEPTHGTVTTATQYRHLTAAPGSEYDPSDDTGAKITSTGGSGVIRVREPWIRISKIGLVMNRSSTTTLRVIRFDRHGWIDRCYCAHLLGSNATNAVIFVSGVISAGHIAKITNCIVEGSGFRGASTGRGARFGIEVGDPTGADGTAEIYNCAVFNVVQTVADIPLGTADEGVAYRLGDNCTIHNCIGLGSQDEDFVRVATPTAESHCISSDSTATAADSYTGESESSIWVDSDNGDLTLVNGCRAINTGKDVSGLWPEGTPEDFIAAFHNADEHGWEIGPYNQNTFIETMMLGAFA
jgi:hypothetical protein